MFQVRLIFSFFVFVVGPVKWKLNWSDMLLYMCLLRCFRRQLMGRHKLRSKYTRASVRWLVTTNCLASFSWFVLFHWFRLRSFSYGIIYCIFRVESSQFRHTKNFQSLIYDVWDVVLTVNMMSRTVSMTCRSVFH